MIWLAWASNPDSPIIAVSQRVPQRYRLRHRGRLRRIGNNTQALEWYQFGRPSVIYNPDFKVMIIQPQITQQHRAMLTMAAQ